MKQIVGKTFEDIGFRPDEQVTDGAVAFTLSVADGVLGIVRLGGVYDTPNHPFWHADWVPHDGGPCPVPDGTRVAVRFRDGLENTRLCAGDWVWDHFSGNGDITHYKILAPESGEYLLKPSDPDLGDPLKPCPKCGATDWSNYKNDHDTYAIAYTSDVIQIGCERHTISEWAEFDDKRILEMDGKTALRWWRKYKDWIFQTIELCPAKPTGTIMPIEKE